MFDDQRDQVGLMDLQVFVLSSNWVQKWLGLRQRCDPDDQHLKQDIRINIEDLQDMHKSKAQDGTKPGAKITKKQVKRRVTRVSDSLGQTSLMGAKP